MKKTVSLILCLLMLSVLLVSCNDNTPADVSNDGSEDVSTVQIEGYDPETNRYVANLPEFSWDISNEQYKTFNVAVTSNEIQTTYFSEDMGYDVNEKTDAFVNDAVRERNNIIEERIGVKINPIYVKDVAVAIKDDIAIGGGAYDMAMPFVSNAVVFAQEGQLYELSDEKIAQYLDVSMPWWNQSANEAYSVDGKLYFTTGDITIMEKINTWAITFNKDMYAELFAGEDSLYDIVKDGKWTFDKLVTMSKTATVENGDGKWDYLDQWGLVSAFSDPFCYYSGSGESIAAKDSDDMPYLTFDTNRSVTVAQRVLEEYSKLNEWHIYSNTLDTADIWQTSLDIFGEGRALFRTSVFSAIKKLRNYENGIEFGIIPIPKFDEEQENYQCMSGAGAFVAVIPLSAPDPEFSAYMTQLVACEAKNYLTPAYYETTLKYRDMRDDESAEMLDDYIFSNLKYDIGYIYNFGGVGNMFNSLAQNGGTDVVSTFDSLKDAANSAIDETIENYRS